MRNTITQPFITLNLQQSFSYLVPVECHGTQALSQTYLFKLKCMIPVDSMQESQTTQDQLLFTPITIAINSSTLPAAQNFSGIVTGIQIDANDHCCTLFIEPALSILKQTKRQRIFLNKKPFDVVNQIIKDTLLYQYPTFKWVVDQDVIQSLPLNDTKDMIMQYQESDFAFISRLLDQIGLLYYFNFADDNHTMYFCHDNTMLKSKDGTIICDVHQQRKNQGFYNWQEVAKFSTTQVVVDSYDYEKAAASLQVGDMSDKGLNHYEFPLSYTQQSQGKDLLNIKQKQLAADQDVFKAKTGRVDLYPGLCCKVQHTTGEENYYIIIAQTWDASAHHHFKDTKDHTSAHNSFTSTVSLIDADQSYFPVCEYVKPNILGLLTALVVTEDDRPVYVDSLARVKVHFMWESDKHQGGQEAWIRILQSSAGNLRGSMWIPRKDEEVLVGFENGDIDKPVIVGSAYNSVNPIPDESIADFPYKTSVHMTSVSHDAIDTTRKNQLIFDNNLGGESIQINAQRDLFEIVQNDAKTIVFGDSHTLVEKGDATTQIAEGDLLTQAKKGITFKVGEGTKLVLKPNSIDLIAKTIHLNPQSILSKIVHAVKGAVSGDTESNAMVKNDTE